MELTTLKATSRVLGANRDNKRLRKAGQIPAVYYGKGTETVNISVSEIDIRKVLAPGKRYTLLDLEIDGKAGNPAVIYNYQKDAISQKFVHIDFLKIDEATPVKVRVPVCHGSGNSLPDALCQAGFHSYRSGTGYLRLRDQRNLLRQGLQAARRRYSGFRSSYGDLLHLF